MNPVWMAFQIFKIVFIIIASVTFPRCFIPLKKGIILEDKKLINIGCAYLFTSLWCIGLFIYLIIVVK